MRFEKERTDSFSVLRGLISNGNEKIDESIHMHRGKADSTLFLYGNTGAGKTTTLYRLGGKNLKVGENEEGILVLEAEHALPDIDIDHTASSGTKIPNSYCTSNVLIWDLPGLNDTGEEVQGIANAFYIRRLFEVSKNARFALVVSDSSITGDRGTQFLKIIESFLKTFTETDFLKSSLSLIVTKVPINRDISKITKSIQNIEDQNISFVSNPEIKKVLGFLKSSIHAIPQPQQLEKGKNIPRNIEMLQTILEKTVETEVGPYLGSFNVDERSENYIIELSKVIESCFKDVIKIITEANSRKHDFSSEDTKPFIDSFEQIRQVEFSPNSCASPKMSKKSYAKIADHFPLIEFLQELEQTLNISNSSLNDIKDALVNNLKIFGNSSKTQETKEIITEYVGIVQNTIECLKFLKDSCGQPSAMEAIAFNAIKECKDSISRELQEQITQIKLVKENSIDYFKQALKLFNLYPENAECKILAAECYYNMGELYIAKNQFPKAVECFNESLKLNKLNSFYVKIADTFYEMGEYKLALETYKVKGVTVKVKRCYKKLEEEISDNKTLSEHYLEKARYFSEIHHYGKVVSFFETAAGLATVEEDRKAILNEAIKTFKIFSENTGPECIIGRWTIQRDTVGGISETHVDNLTDTFSKWVPAIGVQPISSCSDLS